MNSILVISAITIAIYSVILTVIVLVKDNSSCCSVDTIDIVAAGPICWFLFLIISPCVRAIYSLFSRNEQSKSRATRKEFSTQELDKIAKKIVVANRQRKGRIGLEIDLCYSGRFDDDFYGLKFLCIPELRYDRLNGRYENACYYQKEGISAALRKYLNPLTKERYAAYEDEFGSQVAKNIMAI